MQEELANINEKETADLKQKLIELQEEQKKDKQKQEQSAI